MTSGCSVEDAASVASGGLDFSNDIPNLYIKRARYGSHGFLSPMLATACIKKRELRSSTASSPVRVRPQVRFCHFPSKQFAHHCISFVRSAMYVVR